MIVVERLRQVEGEGYTAEHDTQWNKNQMIEAAISYAIAGTERNEVITDEGETVYIDSLWPWRLLHFKPKEDPIRNLVVAGALIAAEIDRLLRLRAKED